MPQFRCGPIGPIGCLYPCPSEPEVQCLGPAQELSNYRDAGDDLGQADDSRILEVFSGLRTVFMFDLLRPL